MDMRNIKRSIFIPIALLLGAQLLSLGRRASVEGTSVAATVQPSVTQSSPSLLVLDKSESQLAIIDPVSLKVVGKVPTGNAPHEVIASADGRYAFVSNYGTAQSPGKTLSMIDIAARKGFRTIDLGPLVRPHGITESAGKIYFTIEGNRAVARYDPVANQIDWLMGTGQSGTHMVVVAPARDKLYTANTQSGSVTMIRLAPSGNLPSIEQIATGPGSEGIDISPDGKQIWVAHRLDGKLSVIETDSDKVVATFDAGKGPIRVKFTPDGRWVLVTDSGTGDLIVFDASTQKETRRIHIGGGPGGVLVEPDGKRAFVAEGVANKVAVIDMNSMAVTGEIDPGREPDGMAWAGR
ncbi:MAG TPA: beta-propeller fold lactonase family protein [Blastocatellia bacterium]